MLRDICQLHLYCAKTLGNVPVSDRARNLFPGATQRHRQRLERTNAKVLFGCSYSHHVYSCFRIRFRELPLGVVPRSFRCTPRLVEAIAARRNLNVCKITAHREKIHLQAPRRRPLFLENVQANLARLKSVRHTQGQAAVWTVVIKDRPP